MLKERKLESITRQEPVADDVLVVDDNPPT
jgi:hypothetical protein